MLTSSSVVRALAGFLAEALVTRAEIELWTKLSPLVLPRRGSPHFLLRNSDTSNTRLAIVTKRSVEKYLLQRSTPREVYLQGMTKGKDCEIDENRPLSERRVSNDGRK
eukprot:Gb_03718 [translate_table: standard]